MLKGFRQWDEERRAQEERIEHLDWKRLERRSEFPSDLTTEDRLNLVLEYLRETPWAKTRVFRRWRNAPQGSSVTLKRRGTVDSVVDALAFALGLKFEGLEVAGDGVMGFWFSPDSRDNCQSDIVVELDTGFTPFEAHRVRSDASVRPGDFDDKATAEFVTEQIGKSVIAAWEESTRENVSIFLLWCDGRLSQITRVDDTIWLNVLDDLGLAVDQAPYGSAIAVVGPH